MAYFDRAAENIENLYGDVPPEAGAPVADALEFKKAGRTGRGTAFSDFHIEHRDLLLAGRVRRLIAGGLAETYAFDEVARTVRPNVSPSTVRRAWKRFGSTVTRSKTGQF